MSLYTLQALFPRERQRPQTPTRYDDTHFSLHQYVLHILCLQEKSITFFNSINSCVIFELNNLSYQLSRRIYEYIILSVWIRKEVKIFEVSVDDYNKTLFEYSSAEIRFIYFSQCLRIDVLKYIFRYLPFSLIFGVYRIARFTSSSSSLFQSKDVLW